MAPNSPSQHRHAANSSQATRALRWTLSLLLFCGLQAFGQRTSELIFAIGSTSFAASHASTVVELPNGNIMSAWFGGSAEGQPDVAVWSAVRTAQGWSRPAVLVREPGIACYNPVLFHTRDGRLWLYYKFGPSPATWSAGRMFSSDQGRTWSPPEHLPAGLLGPIRAKPLVLADGTIVSGSSVESYRTWAAWIERSTDNGAHWTKIGPIVPPVDLDRQGYGDNSTADAKDVPGSTDWRFIQGIIQPSVVSLGGGHLRLYARSTARTARVTIADSHDNGMSWSAARPIDVPNPNSGIDAVALRDGRVVLIYNHSTTARTPLNLAVSQDGLHFTPFRTLEDAPGEYSYPALVQAANGDLLMTYTYNRQSIKFVRLSLAEIPR
jgi:predicted neuraminidase